MQLLFYYVARVRSPGYRYRAVCASVLISAVQIGSDRSMIGTGRCMMHHLISRRDVRPIVTCQQAKQPYPPLDTSAIIQHAPPAPQPQRTAGSEPWRGQTCALLLPLVRRRLSLRAAAPFRVGARGRRKRGFSRRGADAGAVQRWAKGLCPGRRCGVRGFARDETGVDVDSVRIREAGARLWVLLFVCEADPVSSRGRNPHNEDFRKQKWREARLDRQMGFSSIWQ